jgi:hypothetical protein
MRCSAAPAAAVVGELVLGDREQPRGCRRRACLIATARDHRRGERLGRQIRRDVRVAEANVAAGRVRLPREVAGFTFTTLPPNAAQTYRERGRKRTTTIRFDYRVPNG